MLIQMYSKETIYFHNTFLVFILFMLLVLFLISYFYSFKHFFFLIIIINIFNWVSLDEHEIKKKYLLIYLLSFYVRK